MGYVVKIYSKQLHELLSSPNVIEVITWETKAESNNNIKMFLELMGR
jgi:hypothetical protein